MELFREPNALQIRVTLAEIEPAIWRRLVVPWTWHLGQMHLALQAVFGWWNYHLHEVAIGGLHYGGPDSDEWSHETSSRTFDERKVRLLDFEREPGLTFTYLYDFGDSWHHTVEIEKLLALDVAPRSATCIDGARARPPEDVGGVPGYERFLAIMADPRDPEHADMKRWCGGHFDPGWFDQALVDKHMKTALRPNVRRRLHQPKPSRVKRPS